MRRADGKLRKARELQPQRDSQWQSYEHEMKVHFAAEKKEVSRGYSKSPGVSGSRSRRPCSSCTVACKSRMWTCLAPAMPASVRNTTNTTDQHDFVQHTLQQASRFGPQTLSDADCTRMQQLGQYEDAGSLEAGRAEG